MTNRTGLSRRAFFSLAGAGGLAAILPVDAFAQAQMPSASAIERQLEAAPDALPQRRMTVPELKRNQRMRRMAPSIDIQAINFRSGSAEIDRQEYWKLERIGTAIERILWNSPDEVFLIEGHTDAVGSRAANQLLSERRAFTLARALNRNFGISRMAMEPVGYGEDFLVVHTPSENWRNRRVTIRRVTDFISR